MDYENALIVADSSYHKYLIKKLRDDKIISFKIITMNDLKNSYYFTYYDRAINYLLEKYKLNIDVVRVYLGLMIYVKEDIDNVKVNKILSLKKELIDNGLLIYNNVFVNSLKGKRVIIYNYHYLSLEEETLINDIKNITGVEIINEDREVISNNNINLFDTIEDEVVYVASNISKLINQGVSINNIKLCFVDEEYKGYVKRIFRWFNIPININDEYLFNTVIGKAFLDNFDNGLDYVKNNFNLDDINNLELYNEIVDIVNRYIWVDSSYTKKIFIEDRFKKTIVNKKKYKEEIEVINSLVCDNEDYVFLMGFNQGIIPKIYKDEDYFNDNIKKLLGMDTTNDLNKLEYNRWLYNIKHTTNLIITSKRLSPLGEFYISCLNEDLGYDIVNPGNIYNYSNLYNKIELTKKLDSLIKYGDKDINLDYLYSNYKDIEYGNFKSFYTGVDKDKLLKYLGYKFNLSYSSMNTYYECGYKYYLKKILKVDMFEESFSTIVGNLFHYILSKVVTSNINIYDEYYNYIDNCDYSFNEREKFFLDNLYNELEFIIKTIERQNSTNSLNNILTEEYIEIDKSVNNVNVTFMGYIDKIFTNDDNSIGAIIDYKTGNPNVNLNNSIYGLDLQLPVYVYLLRNKFPNIKLAGFYLQKILNNEIARDNKHSYNYLKEDNLKLQGYSNSDLSILSLFDSNYMNSDVIKGMRTTSKGIGTKKVLDNDKIDKLEGIVNDKIEGAIEGIINAQFSINPKRIGKDLKGCSYCNFKSICFMKEDNIVELNEYKDMEFLND